MGSPGPKSIKTTVLLFIALGAAISARAQTPQLAFSGAREDYPYNGAFAIGDFNGDGFPDIATSDPSNMVVILLNDGTGHYIQSAAIPGSAGGYFAAGDFNNDGFLDVAFTAYNSVYIALGKGDGTLAKVSEVSGGNGGDIVAVDLNGDGKLDVVVGGYNVSYFLGYGDGTLQSPVTFSNFSSPFAVIDVNGDKKPDILGVTQGTLEVELNNGNGTFTLGPKTTLPSNSIQALAAGDIDGNGTADVTVSSLNPNTLIILKGDGHGNFTISSSLPISLEAGNVALLDVNADGKLDLLYNRVPGSQPPATNLVVQLGNGNGTFGPTTGYATAGANYRIALADTRRSGQLDLLTGGSNQLSVLTNKGDNTFRQGSYFKLDGVLQSTVDGDFNHDGIKDLVVSVRLSAGNVAAADGAVPDINSQFAGAYILLGTGNPKAPFTVKQRLYIPPDVLKVATADFNNDGYPDLAFVTGQDLVIYLGVGDGTFKSGAQYTCSCFNLALGDFNGDGNIDIATSGVYLYLGKGDGTFASPSLPFVGGTAFLGAADFNGDGKIDLISSQSNSGTFITALSNGNGTFSLKSSTGTSGVVSGAIADFNGDGLPDLAVLNNYGIYIYLNLGGGALKEVNSFNTGYSSGANTIAVADFDHNGTIDLAAPGIDMMIFPGIGGGFFAGPVEFGAANYPNVIIADDFYDFGTGQLPDLIGIGQNGAISTLFNESH